MDHYRIHLPHKVLTQSMTANRRVVITGMGIISPLGNSAESLWQSITSGTSGVSRIDRLSGGDFPCDIAGQAKSFTGHIDDFGQLEKMAKRNIKKGLRLMCREIQMGVAASQLALADSNLSEGSYDPVRTGTMFGCDYIVTEPFEFVSGMKSCLEGNDEFNFDDWAEMGIPKVEPLWLLKYLPNMPASHVAIYNDLRGPSNSITVREASANLALAEATTTLRRNAADTFITGATGSRIQTMRTIHVTLQELTADIDADPVNGDPAKACRPFELDRTGAVIGEGAGILILEGLESAQKRGAKIWGEVIGYGSSAVANKNGIANYETALSNVAKSALETSGLTPEQIGHVNAHGLGTPKCDAQEARAIHSIFGDQKPVTAIKSYTGNMGAGSGIIEIISSLLAMEHGHLPKTLNYDRPDPECPINVVNNDSTEPGDTFLNLNVSPQGQASSVIVKRFEQ